MAQAQQINAGKLAGLEKFADQVFHGAQGDYSLKQYAYFDDTSLFSTAFFEISGSAIAAGATQRLFSTALGDRPAALTRALTACETNLEGGSTGGKMASNQAYVGLAGGFDIYHLNSGGLTPVKPFAVASDVHQIAASIVWSWNVGGLSNPTVNYEPIKLWPLSAGVTGVQAGVVSTATGATAAIEVGVPGGNAFGNGANSQMRKFAFPLFFPPEISVNCNLTAARGISGLADSTGFACVAMHLRGYKLSQIRG